MVTRSRSRGRAGGAPTTAQQLAAGGISHSMSLVADSLEYPPDRVRVLPALAQVGARDTQPAHNRGFLDEPFAGGAFRLPDLRILTSVPEGP